MLLSDKTTNPGDLRTRLTLLRPAVSADGGGAQSVAYTNAGKVWAKWVNAHGAEAVVDGAVQAPKRATVRVRYRADLTAAWAIQKGSERYQILTPPDDIQERHEYLEFQVQAFKASA